MLQLVYVSSARPTGGAVNAAAILNASRRNNRRDGITGLLYSDGRRFLQALEGPEDAVQQTFERIQGDSRHRAIVVLSRRHIEAREFGAWDMAHLDEAAETDSFMRRISKLAAGASPDVRATFEGFAEVRRQA
ncbi:BLUF domain-containing protein [Sphingosinithalassobacter sp. CS137]|uniref:BLUF domain-containing protein n=1 Tax=Sphingosinithalassobacter sp. CS137 TaxID=2762748 RepID=UPI00165DB505|nr:BLUF domain-containing protein [Sphingosinithalassobacter sp. CS137]